MTLLLSTISKCRKLSFIEFLRRNGLLNTQNSEEDSEFTYRKPEKGMDPAHFFSTDIPRSSTKPRSRMPMPMFTSKKEHELSAFLTAEEKDSILDAIGVDDKLVASGICRLVISSNGQWTDEHEPGVVAFVKNNVEKQYKVMMFELYTDGRKAHVSLDMTVARDFETVRGHSHLVTFAARDDVIGLNFYDEQEAKAFHEAVVGRKVRTIDRTSKRVAPPPPGPGELHNPHTSAVQTTTTAVSAQSSNEPQTVETSKKKKKKGSSIFKNIFGTFKGHKKKEHGELQIESPTDFKHLHHVGMNSDQQELYTEILGKLNTETEEEKELVRKIVLINEDKLRRSMIKKKKKTTPRDVKRNSKQKDGEKVDSGIKIDVPVDPMNPDWGTGSPKTSSSAAPSSPFGAKKESEVVKVSSGFRMAHTLGSQSTYSVLTRGPDRPMSAIEPSASWEASSATSTLSRTQTWATADDRSPASRSPAMTSYSGRAHKDPQHLYRFEEEQEHVEDSHENAPPPLPSRSTSRPTLERRPTPGYGVVRPSPRDTPPPRLPKHRNSYRWATNQETEDMESVPTTRFEDGEKSRSIRIVEDNNNSDVGISIRLRPDMGSSSGPPPPPPLPTTSPSTLKNSEIAPISSGIPVPPPPPPPDWNQQNVAILVTPSKDMPTENNNVSKRGIVPAITNDRRSLLDAIQSADRSKILRKVSDTPSLPSPANSSEPSGGNSMIDEIQHFLDARRLGINPSDSEDSDDSDSESWDD